MIVPLALAHGACPIAEAAVYVTPAGLNVVVRHLLVVNTSGGAAAVSVSIRGNRVMGAESVAANKRAEQWFQYPLVGGDTITAVSSAAGVVLLLEGFSR